MEYIMDRNAELEPTLRGVLENYALPKDLGRKVAERCFAGKFGSTLHPHGRAPALIGNSLPWLLVAALAGALIGYVGFGSQISLGNQLMMAEVYGGRGPRGGIGLGVLSSGILPASAATLRVIFLVFLILFVTRAKAWRMIFPQRLPAGLVVARWLAMLAALFGVARVVSGIFLAVLLFGDLSLSSRGRSSGGGFVAGVAFLLDQLWWVTFWVAALAVLLVAVNLWTQRYLRPQTNDR